MNQTDKITLLQASVRQLRVDECKSINYITKLLRVDRKVLTEKISEWGYQPKNDKKGIKPSTQKFLNKNKQRILSYFNQGFSIGKIAKEIGTTEDLIRAITKYDDGLNKAFEVMKSKKEVGKENSYHEYDVKDIEGEEWKPVLGYESYEVSNMGRIRKYTKRYKSYYLLSQSQNVISKRMYVALSKDGKKENLQVARLVGFAFCKGHSKDNNTINHKDGNVENNKASNLEWISQKPLKRKVNHAKPINYIIEYQGKYNFKTVAAFARFIAKSETQVRRYLREPSRHNIRLISKEHDCNDYSERKYTGKNSGKAPVEIYKFNKK